jgi:hypothetical protein
VSEQLANSTFIDEDSRKLAMEKAAQIDEAARQRGLGDK